MKNILYFLLFLFVFSACDDGNVIVTTFEFDDASLENCGESGGYVFYKINTSTAESLSLNVNTDDVLFEEEGTRTFVLNGTSNIVNYRKYSSTVDDTYFCSVVPPTSPSVTSEFIASSGEAILATIIIFDDEDGIDEEISDLDTDGDGLPNYYDSDDDGDNVTTIIELGADFLNGIDDNPRDSDGDGIFDYLDADDDGDNILSRNEDLNSDLDPALDFSDLDDGRPDYLNPNIFVETIVNEYRGHSYKLQSDISLILNNLVLINGSEEITQESLNMGIKTSVFTEDIIITPEFND